MRRKLLKKKKFFIRQGQRIARHERDRKLVRIRRRYSRLPDKIKRSRAIKFEKNPKKAKHDTHVAPEVFSLLEDPKSVIRFINTTKNSFSKNMPVFFDLSNIKVMGPDTLTFFCALIQDDKYLNGNAIQGNIPKEKELRVMFNKAGFDKFVSPNEWPREYSRDDKGELHRLTHELVESPFAGEICASAMLHTYGKKVNPKNQNFYRILIECMSNTKNHANYGRAHETYSWWLIAYKESVTKITKFCFLDLGVGIFGSLNSKYLHRNLAELLNWFTPNKNRETLTKIFEGERQTSTKHLEGRGQGLNYIYQLVKSDSTINNFTILSNDIMAKIVYNTDDIIEKVDFNFPGTFYYWEVVPYGN